MFSEKYVLVMEYHQGVQKQNCLKCFFIRKQIGVSVRKLQGIGKERSLTIAAKIKLSHNSDLL